MRSYLNGDELEALRGLPHEARTLYREGLRPYMDFDTGLVGCKRRVSYQQFSELLEVVPDRGSKLGATWRPTRDALRNTLEQLRRRGLVVKLEQARRTDPMVFKLPLADGPGPVRPNEEPHMNPIDATPQGAPRSGSVKVMEDQEDNSVTPDRNTTHSPIGGPVDEPHTSDTPIYNTTTTGAVIEFSQAAQQRGSLVDQWELGGEARAMLRFQGVPDKFVSEQLCNFKLYWRDRAERRTSWDAQFVKQCLSWWRRNGHQWKAADGHSRGFIETHTDRSWAEDLGE